MVLNCAAYLFNGVALEADDTLTTEKASKVAVQAGLRFLPSVLGIGGNREQTTTEENRSSRRFTVGGLHMNVLDLLESEGMIHTIPNHDFHSEEVPEEKYVQIRATLQPTEYYSLIAVIKMLTPLVSQLLTDFGGRVASQSKGANAQPNQPKKGQPTGNQQSKPRFDMDKVAHYEQSITNLVEKLERDYLTARQLELLMVVNSTTVGVVDLEVSEQEDVSELRARLSGGTFYVIGKPVASVGKEGKLNLMQKSVLSDVVDLTRRLWAFLPELQELKKLKDRQDGQDTADNTPDFEAITTMIETHVIPNVQQLVRTHIDGPAVRIAAMSLCI
jgi:hypothetical protein